MSFSFQTFTDEQQEQHLLGRQSASTRRRFLIEFSILMLVGSGMVILLTVWLTNFGNKGFGWDTEHIFNFHPLFMVSGMVFMGAKGVLMYRLLPRQPKPRVKAAHMLLNFLALAHGIVGFAAVVTQKSRTGSSHFYSLHSWIGGAAFLMMAAQWLLGLLIFVWPGASQPVRAKYLQLHRFWGPAIFSLCCLAAGIGLSKKAAFIAEYSKLPSSGAAINSVAVLLVAFALGVGYLLSRQEYRRVD